jgi:type I restriction enzyme S subunit
MAGEVPEPALNRGWLYHPEFPAHWHRRSLYSLATWVNGIAFKDIQFAPTGRPVIKIAEIKGGISGQTKFTRQTFDESVFVRAGDLLFSWSGQPETSIDAFWWRGPEGWLNQHVFRVTPTDGIDKVFLYYLLRYLKPNFVGIARNKQTTGLGHVTKRDMENMEVAHPDLPEQRAIAHILGTLDDKIEVNRRMSATLEAMARAIFQDWFVDFGPTRAKMEGRPPYLAPDLWSLFPDRLDAEGKPEGWQHATVGSEFRLTMGQSPPGETYNTSGDGMPFFQGRSDFGFRYPSRRMFCTAPSRIAEEEDTLVSVRAPVGDLNLATETCCIGRGVAAVRHRLSGRSYTYYALGSIQSELKAFEHTGTVFGSINKAQLEALPILAPPDRVVAAFEAVVSAFDGRIRLTHEEAETLAATRDLLLPRLMSGEFRVRDAERFLERVI